jgi:hypothetical protein
MCQGRLSHTVRLHLVLIACAIQGVTPDPQDLASNNCLLILFPTLADPNCLIDDNGMPDEVCRPAESEIDSLWRASAASNELPCSAHASRERPAHTIHASAARVPDWGGDLARVGELIYSLCRLNC